MTDRRSHLGVTASLAWIALVAFLLFRDPIGVGKMTPNDWGSFLSGTFAPLGFLWLVLGYLQQGEELKLSTQALRLQAEELKNSVEQQRALVEVSRLQIESERQALLEERKSRVEEAKPKITLESDGGSFRGDGQSSYPFKFSNSGNTACSLQIIIRFQLGKFLLLKKSPAFERGALHGENVQVERPDQIEGAIIEVRYNDQLGNPYFHRYLVTRQTDDPHSSLKIAPIEA